MTGNIILSVVEMLGIGAFLYYLIRGLKTKITSLEDVVNVQNKTLEVMEKRIEETEKVGNIYKRLISDLPTDLENFKAIVSKTKDDVILELKNANEEKEKRITELRDAEARLKESTGQQSDTAISLQILTNLLSSEQPAHSHQKMDLRVISELGNRRIEDIVPALAASKTVDEYLSSLGYQITLSEEQPDIKTIFGDKDNPPPSRIEVGYASMGINGWFAVRNNELMMNRKKLDHLKDEFSTVKTVKI